VWCAVADKEAAAERDEEMLATAKGLLQRHKDQAADDAAPLKWVRMDGGWMVKQPLWSAVAA
jgi:hypothetical protein